MALIDVATLKMSYPTPAADAKQTHGHVFSPDGRRVLYRGRAGRPGPGFTWGGSGGRGNDRSVFGAADRLASPCGPWSPIAAKDPDKLRLGRGAERAGTWWKSDLVGLYGPDERKDKGYGMPKNTSPRIKELDVAMAVIAHKAVPCVCGREQATSPQPKNLVSCTGGTFWGRSGEAWLVTAGGHPLVPWLQVACTELERPGRAFHNRTVTSFYIWQDFAGYEAISRADQSDFVVREYGADDELVPLERPAALAGHPFHRVIWERVQDYPGLSKYHGLFDDDVYAALCRAKRFKYENRSGLKIGGWPTPVQRGQEYPGSHDLQIDMTENYRYGDAGIAYLSRSGGQWYVCFECC